jgi:hypothetical protein
VRTLISFLLEDRADQFEIYGHRVDVASIDDVIAMKQAANRPKG